MARIWAISSGAGGLLVRAKLVAMPSEIETTRIGIRMYILDLLGRFTATLYDMDPGNECDFGGGKIVGR